MVWLTDNSIPEMHLLFLNLKITFWFFELLWIAEESILKEIPSLKKWKRKKKKKEKRKLYLADISGKLFTGRLQKTIIRNSGAKNINMEHEIISHHY